MMADHGAHLPHRDTIRCAFVTAALAHPKDLPETTTNVWFTCADWAWAAAGEWEQHPETLPALGTSPQPQDAGSSSPPSTFVAQGGIAGTPESSYGTVLPQAARVPAAGPHVRSASSASRRCWLWHGLGRPAGGAAGRHRRRGPWNRTIGAALPRGWLAACCRLDFQGGGERRAFSKKKSNR